MDSRAGRSPFRSTGSARGGMRRILLGACCPILLAGGDLRLLELRSTLRTESLRLPGGEAMGLTGVSGTATFGSLYLGPGVYGASRGERGGFITLGLEAGLRGRIPGRVPLEWDMGLFTGGGGGAGAPQGGGLMLRPHVGAALGLGPLRLGAEVARVRFPDGGIDSTQAALTLAIAYGRLWRPEGGWGGDPAPTVAWEARGTGLEASRLQPSGTARTRSGRAQPPLDLAGFTVASTIRGPWFRFLAADGAVRGASAGYAQALAGLGCHRPLAGPLGFEVRLAVGFGGGGDLDTGGGLLVSGEAALTLGGRDWQAGAGIGLLDAPGGHLLGRSITLRLSRRFDIPVPRQGGQDLAAFDLADWQVGTGLITYRRTVRADGGTGPVQLMALRAKRLLEEGFYLTGEAASATGGGAGGYSTGLAGVGVRTPAVAKQRLFLEAALGAGGGGGLDSGSGLLASWRVGWSLEFAKGFGIEATAGRIRSLHGGLSTPAYGVGGFLRFATPTR